MMTPSEKINQLEAEELKAEVCEAPPWPLRAPRHPLSRELIRLGAGQPRNVRSTAVAPSRKISSCLLCAEHHDGKRTSSGRNSWWSKHSGRRTLSKLQAVTAWHLTVCLSLGNPTTQSATNSDGSHDAARHRRNIERNEWPVTK